MWHQAPKLSSLNGLQVEKLLQLEELGFEYYPYGKMVQVSGDFFATHGDIVRAHAGFTAKAMVDKTGVSGIMGHTHRLGQSTRRILDSAGGTKLIGWWENGCLCDQTKMDWTTGVQDWHLGFSVGTFFDDEGSNKFAIEPVFVHDNGSFVFGGNVYD